MKTIVKENSKKLTADLTSKEVTELQARLALAKKLDLDVAEKTYIASVIKVDNNEYIRNLAAKHGLAPSDNYGVEQGVIKAMSNKEVEAVQNKPAPIEETPEKK